MEDEIFAPLNPHNWRMRVNKIGNVTWRYLSLPKDLKDERPQTFIEKYILKVLKVWNGVLYIRYLTLIHLASAGPKPDKDYTLAEVSKPRHSDVVKAGLKLSTKLQHETGMFPGCCDAVLYLTPMYLMSLFVCEAQAPKKYVPASIQYLFSVVNEDGGWGL